MRKTHVALLALAIVVSVFAVAAAAPPEARNFMAHLSGSEEVPAVNTDASGVAIFQLGGDGKALEYKLNVEDIEGVTQAHLHLGAPGTNGPVVAFLFGRVPDPGVDGDGRLARGTITEADLRGPYGATNMPDRDAAWNAFVSALRAGNLYANVHTVTRPGGEIRGRIRTNGPHGG